MDIISVDICLQSRTEIGHDPLAIGCRNEAMCGQMECGHNGAKRGEDGHMPRRRRVGGEARCITYPRPSVATAHSHRPSFTLSPPFQPPPSALLADHLLHSEPPSPPSHTWLLPSSPTNRDHLPPFSSVHLRFSRHPLPSAFLQLWPSETSALDRSSSLPMCHLSAPCRQPPPLRPP